MSEQSDKGRGISPKPSKRPLAGTRAQTPNKYRMVEGEDIADKLLAHTPESADNEHHLESDDSQKSAVRNFSIHTQFTCS